MSLCIFWLEKHTSSWRSPSPPGSGSRTDMTELLVGSLRLSKCGSPCLQTHRLDIASRGLLTCSVQGTHSDALCLVIGILHRLAADCTEAPHTDSSVRPPHATDVRVRRVVFPSLLMEGVGLPRQRVCPNSRDEGSLTVAPAPPPRLNLIERSQLPCAPACKRPRARASACQAHHLSATHCVEGVVTVSLRDATHSELSADPQPAAMREHIKGSQLTEQMIRSTGHS